MGPQGNMEGAFCVPRQQKWSDQPQKWLGKSKGHWDQIRRERPGLNREPRWSLCKEAETALAHAACPGAGARRDWGLRTAEHSPQDFTAIELLSAFAARY